MISKNNPLKKQVSNGYGNKAFDKRGLKIFKMKMFILDNGGFVDDHTPYKKVRKLYKKLREQK